jgi:hypothetical protein
VVVGKLAAFKYALIGAWDTFRSFYYGLRAVDNPEALDELTATTTLKLK